MATNPKPNLVGPKPKTTKRKPTFTVEVFSGTVPGWVVKTITDNRESAIAYLDANYSHGSKYRIVKQIGDIFEFQEKTVTTKVSVSGPIQSDDS